MSIPVLEWACSVMMRVVQLVGDAVVRHRVHHGVAEDDLAVVGCGRVVVEHGLHVGVEQSLDFGQGIDEFQGEAFGFFIDPDFGQEVAVFAELQSVGNLLGQQACQFFHIHADAVRAYGFVGLSFVEVVGEDDVLYQADDFLDLFYRRQGCIDGWHHADFLLGELREQGYILQ